MTHKKQERFGWMSALWNIFSVVMLHSFSTESNTSETYPKVKSSDFMTAYLLQCNILVYHRIPGLADSVDTNFVNVPTQIAICV